MAFNATGKAPGVYIDEVQLPGPIPGVGTSTAAFIGPAAKGPLNKPTFLTNLTQFDGAFGGVIPGGPVYVGHAVRGFFANGGASCYFVRVGTAARASRTLLDRATTPQATLVVTAKEEGVSGNDILVDVQDAHIVATVDAARGEATLSSAGGDQATVTAAADAANFRPGDIVFLEDAATNERATVASISGATIRLATNLANTYAAGTIRVADLVPGQRQVRLVDVAGVEPGSYVRVTQGATTEDAVVAAVQPANRHVTLSADLTQTFTMATGDPAVTVQTLEFALVVARPSAGSTTFDDLAMDPRHSRYFAKVVTSDLVDVARADPPTTTPPPGNLPAAVSTSLAGGANDDITDIQPSHYRDALAALERVDNVNMLCIPDRTDQDVQSQMIQHCERMQDRFAILDSVRNASRDVVVVQRQGDATPTNVGLASENGFAALYYPWIVISDPAGTGRLTVPPSGHIAGVYARTDERRGVHKAPANEALRGAVSLERVLNDGDQGPLNDLGINVIRAFPGQGLLVWGARTIAVSTQWRYVNVRRLLLFIEESIQEGTRFAVFEPNDLALWGRLKRQVSDFLTRVWRDGALFGATPEDAFRVRIDEELNPPDQRSLGLLVIEVIVCPTTPAEFVVFRIIQRPNGPLLEE